MPARTRFGKLTRHFFHVLNKPIIISLFDYSGIWPMYYARAGFRVLQVDLKLGIDIFDFRYRELNKDLVFGILAAPPCTDFAVSGAQYWTEKDKTGQTAKSVALVRKTLEIVDYFDPHFWALENPVGRLPDLVPELGNPWYFQPHQFGDPWTKKTGLWGRFNKPKPNPVKAHHYSAQGSWTQILGGKSEQTKALRSMTSLSFAKAFYKANHSILKHHTSKIMEHFKHNEFVKSNDLQEQSFSVPVQTKMKIFKRMYGKLKDTVDEDREQLTQKLIALSSEILHDMESEFEDKLENNQIETTNEDILEDFYKKKQTVALSQLRAAGFKGYWNIPAGDYSLQRISTFSFIFRVRKRH